MLLECLALCLVQRPYSPTGSSCVITVLGIQKLLSKCNCDHHPPEDRQSCQAPFNSLEMVANCRSCRHLPEVPFSLNSSYSASPKTVIAGWWCHGIWEINCESASFYPWWKLEMAFSYQDGRFKDVNIKPVGLLAQAGPRLRSSLPWGGVFCRD